MRNHMRGVLSSACALALLVNGLTGAMAQDKKQEKSAQEKTVYTVSIQTADGQRTARIRTSDIATGNYQTPAGGDGGWAYATTQGGDNVFQFFSREMSFDNRLVKGAPFSADIVSETVQTLTDGNRIMQRSEGHIYRDSQGRTRNERTFQVGGSADQKQTVSILDPVANVNSMLDPEARTARKTPFFFAQSGGGGGMQGTMTLVNPDNSADAKKISMASGVLQGGAIKKVQPYYPAIAKAAGAEGPVQVQVVISENGVVSEASVISGHPLLREAALEAARQWQFKPTEVSAKPVKVQGVLTFNFMLEKKENSTPVNFRVEKKENSTPVEPIKRVAKYATNTEQLGKQMIEGVECEGMRSTTTMPAGAIGNERPIETVTESWYSPDLKMMILTKRNDPRFGESTYRVTNINRAEPDASLFQVPSDYTVKEGGFSFSTASSVDVKGVVEGETKKARKPNDQ